MDIIAKIAKQILDKPEPIPPDILDHCFPKQLDFIKSSHKRKVCVCSRRSGKSFLIGLALLHIALINPNCKCLYLSLTNQSAKNILWKDILQPILIKYNIKHIFSKSRNEIELENKSVIYMMGADATDKQKDRIRGQKYRLAAIDEAQSFTTDLNDLIQAVLAPTLAETNSALIVAGTPSNPFGYFFDITHTDTSWEVWNWTWKENPIVCNQIEIEIQDMIKKNPLIVDDPKFRQEFLGEWVLDIETAVYKFSDKNITQSTPYFPNPTYILSIDLGYEDDTSFLVSAYDHKYSNILYIIKSYKKQHLIISDVVSEIKKLQTEYKFTAIICDCAAKQAVEEIRQRYYINLIAADKLGKLSHIAILNSDLIMNQVRILPSNIDLIQELSQLTWSRKQLEQGKFVEDPSCPNHLCFIAGTKIHTSKGLINIEDIKVGDLILTRKGFLPAVWSGKTGTIPTYNLQTIYGNNLIATKNHPIFSNNKLIPLSQLKTGDNLTYIIDNQETKSICQIKTDNQLQLNTKELYIGDIHNLLIENLKYIGKTNIVIDFIELYMKKIMDKYLMDIVFIIKIMILSIMKLIIYNYYQLAIICQIIPMNDYKIQNIKINLLHNCYQLMILQNYGIRLQKDLNGINNMEKIHGKIKQNHLNIYVLYVIMNFIQKLIMQLFAQINVLQDKEETQELITNLEVVQPAINNSNVINILNKNIVQDYVYTIEPTNKIEDVYNITVKDQHEYFANNILVSNTDALLYNHNYAKTYYYKEPIKQLPIEDKIYQEIEDKYLPKKRILNLKQPFWARED